MTIAVRIICIAGLISITSTTWAASTKQEVLELQEQVEALQIGQEEMQKDIDELIRLMRQGAGSAPSAPAFAEQDVTIGASPFKGEAGAPVTLIEYSDYQCPFCARHYREVLPTLVTEYIDSGKVKYVMRENPIARIHPQAVDASMAALCAGDQDMYWEMHNTIFDNQKNLTADELKVYASDIGLDSGAFNECFDSRKYEKQINDDLASGSRLGVSGTPGFVLGFTDSENSNKARMVMYIKGAQPLENFKRAIDQLLKEAD